MGRGLWRLAVAGIVAASVVLPVLPASAAADSVTLQASKAQLTYGESVTLSGQIDPASGGETVEIRAGGTLVTSATTNGSGAYSTQIQPEANLTLRAVWGAVESATVTVKVRPVLTATIGGVKFLGTAVIKGTLAPARPGDSVRVTLLRGSNRVGRRTVALQGGERFRAKFRILRTGRYRAEVRFNDQDHLPARELTRAKRVRLPRRLAVGSKGSAVLLLERRLKELSYHITPPDRRYDFRTGDAVLAFHKVQGMSRVKSVSGRTWKKLAKPRRPQPRSKRPRFHIEVDQTRQVLYVVRGGKIDEIVHTSTGKGGATRDGVFRVHRKIAGYSPGRLYYPSYFDGNRAVHGWPSVPTYPASHGCARVPYWTAQWLHRIMPYGTVVRVYHS